MAREVRQFSVECLAGVPSTAPTITDLLMPARIVRQITVRVPPGPRGLMGFQIAAAGVALIPLEAGQWVVADDETLTWVVDGYINSGAWQAIMYNTGVWPHTISIRFEVDTPWNMAAASSPSAPLSSSLIAASAGAAGAAGTGASLPGGATGTGVTTLPGPSGGGALPGGGEVPPGTGATGGQGTAGTPPATTPSTTPSGTAGTAPAVGYVVTAAGTLPQCGYDAAPTFQGSAVPVPPGALGGWCLYRPGHVQQGMGLPTGWYMNNPALPGVQPEVSVFAIAVPPFYLDGAGLPLKVVTPVWTWWLVRGGGGGATPWYFTYSVNNPIPGSAEDPLQKIAAAFGNPAAPVATPPTTPAFTPPPTPAPV